MPVIAKILRTIMLILTVLCGTAMAAKIPITVNAGFVGDAAPTTYRWVPGPEITKDPEAYEAGLVYLDRAMTEAGFQRVDESEAELHILVDFGVLHEAVEFVRDSAFASPNSQRGVTPYRQTHQQDILYQTVLILDAMTVASDVQSRRWVLAVRSVGTMDNLLGAIPYFSVAVVDILNDGESVNEDDRKIGGRRHRALLEAILAGEEAPEFKAKRLGHSGTIFVY